jgi:hypothetical protein
MAVQYVANPSTSYCGETYNYPPKIPKTGEKESKLQEMNLIVALAKLSVGKSKDLNLFVGNKKSTNVEENEMKIKEQEYYNSLNSEEKEFYNSLSENDKKWLLENSDSELEMLEEKVGGLNNNNEKLEQANKRFISRINELENEIDSIDYSFDIFGF